MKSSNEGIIRLIDTYINNSFKISDYQQTIDDTENLFVVLNKLISSEKNDELKLTYKNSLEQYNIQHERAIKRKSIIEVRNDNLMENIEQNISFLSLVDANSLDNDLTELIKIYTEKYEKTLKLSEYSGSMAQRFTKLSDGHSDYIHAKTSLDKESNNIKLKLFFYAFFQEVVRNHIASFNELSATKK